MKKIWKNLCACSLALACGVGVAACGEDKDNKPKDLDGDGIVSSWETFFDESSNTNTNNGHVIVGDIQEISNADQLLDINNNTDTRKIYVLTSNIDLGGGSVSINLGKSEFYGNNHTISNFTLGDMSSTDDFYYAENYSETNAKCLFYNGTGVYSTRLFMGVQTLNIDSSNSASCLISPFINVPSLTGVEVKGRINLNAKNVYGRVGKSKVEASLLYSGVPTVVESDTLGEQIFDNDVQIENVNVDGLIVLSEESDSGVGFNIGTIASSITKNSTIYNAFSQAGIDAGVSSYQSNIGGVVGHNKGFISTCTYTGAINFNNNINGYAAMECVGGIVGFNDSLAEIKNCSTNSAISMVNTEKEIRDNDYRFGGIAGMNRGGVIELCQSDATLNFSNISQIITGGICGYNDKGIISYGISRGSVNIVGVKPNANSNDSGWSKVAQVAGFSNLGYFEKVVTTTSINLDNSALPSSNVEVGLVTVFDVSNDGIECSPYFNKILVDGKTELFVGEGEGHKVVYDRGLRYSYRVLIGQEGEEDVYSDTPVTPIIFKDLYKTNNYSLLKYTMAGGQKVKDDSVTSDTPLVVGRTITPSIMIDLLDFKDFLNHKEVSVGSQVNLNELHFTITDKSERMQSYFGDSKYNGELAYFDREFTQSYIHTESALGSCENDKVDELFSFVYDLVKVGNVNSYAIKLNDNFLGYSESGEEGGEEYGDRLSQKTRLFKEKMENVLSCLGVTPNLMKLDVYGNDVELAESGTADVKYLQFTFNDETNFYEIKIDISNLESEKSTSGSDQEESVFNTEYILYLTFKVTTKLG